MLNCSLDYTALGLELCLDDCNDETGNGPVWAGLMVFHNHEWMLKRSASNVQCLELLSMRLEDELDQRLHNTLYFGASGRVQSGPGLNRGKRW